MNEYEQEIISTVELALAVEAMSPMLCYRFFGGLDDTVEIFRTYTKAYIREALKGGEHD